MAKGSNLHDEITKLQNDILNNFNPTKFLTESDKLTASFNEYEGVTSRLKDAQKLMNMSMTDSLMAADAKTEFEEWFKDNVKFNFFMRWLKPIAKKFYWRGYFAGYKSNHVMMRNTENDQSNK